MPNYAIIENNVIVNVCVSNEDYANEQNWTLLPEGAGIGWLYDGQKWINTNQPTIAQLAESARNTRNQKLKLCDWTQLPDAPVNKQAWADYRQELRDIPQQNGFPTEINWPQEPQ